MTFPQNANHRGFIWKNISNCYTISCIMSKSGQIYFKNLSVFTHHKIFEVCLTIFSRLEVFCKKGVLKNLAKLTGKHLCWSLFFNKVAGLRLATLLKKRLQHWCFPVNFAKFLRTPFFYRIPPVFFNIIRERVDNPGENTENDNLNAFNTLKLHNIYPEQHSLRLFWCFLLSFDALVFYLL